MQVLIFNEFGLEMPNDVPKMGYLGVFDAINGEQPHCYPQKAPPCAETRHTTYIVKIGPLPTPKILCFTMLFNRPDTPKVPLSWQHLHPI